ncbi:MAG: ATP synthase F0 subunit B, partial [Dehalococcoidia bacterium]|nr:ATP synthase F0 subunit B [Dehalococcoidia bacterium]
MEKNANKKDVVELWGREFKKVKSGLDEEQVVSFVNELMNEHKTLLERAEHLSSLTKLAEKTVVEAENVAKQIQKEAADQAKAEAKTIIAKAEEQAQKVFQEKSAEAIVMANREAEAIKAKAQQQAELLLEERTKEIQPKLRDIAKRLYGELLSQFESLKQQVVASEEGFDHKLSRPLPQTSNVSKEADKLGHEFLELTQPIDETNAGEPDWELEISPPIDLTQILDIMNHLDSLPEVENTELIPRVDSPSIIVFVREPIDLIDRLKTLPQVAQVTGDATESTDAQYKPGKVQIVLSGKTT